MDKFLRVANTTMFCVILALTIGCSDRYSKPFLAHDSKTGEYLGVVVSECRDWESKEVRGYKVRLEEGSVVEKSPERITINPP